MTFLFAKGSNSVDVLGVQSKICGDCPLIKFNGYQFHTILLIKIDCNFEFTHYDNAPKRHLSPIYSTENIRNVVIIAEVHF